MAVIPASESDVFRAVLGANEIEVAWDGFPSSPQTCKPLYFNETMLTVQAIYRRPAAPPHIVSVSFPFSRITGIAGLRAPHDGPNIGPSVWHITVK